MYIGFIVYTLIAEFVIHLILSTGLAFRITVLYFSATVIAKFDLNR